MTAEERQRAPGDWEAQVGQGSITFHSEEHLASSDRGIAMLRRFFRRQIEVVAAARNPAGALSKCAMRWLHLKPAIIWDRRRPASA